MFGFSLQKLLLLAAVIGAVWYGFKLISRLQEARELDQKARGKRDRVRSAERDAKRAARAETVEEMVRCPVCDSFVSARARSNCGRADCPY